MADLSRQLCATDARGPAALLGWAFGGLVDVVLFLLLVLAFPLVILLVGLPVAFLVRVILEIVQRL